MAAHPDVNLLRDLDEALAAALPPPAPSAAATGNSQQPQDQSAPSATTTGISQHFDKPGYKVLSADAVGGKILVSSVNETASADDAQIALEFIDTFSKMAEESFWSIIFPFDVLLMVEEGKQE